MKKHKLHKRYRNVRALAGVLVVGMMMVGCGEERKTDRRLQKRLQEVEKLCMEERYDEAITLADEYLLSHPCSIDDVVSGQNTLYKDLSESEIRFRLRLASYTKTALIGSGKFLDRFFSYYRTPEIYNEIEDYVQQEFSLSGMLRQRALENPTVVYYLGINVAERDGVSGEVLALMVPAMMACQQWNLAEKYIRVWAGLKGWKKEALKYGEVLAFLRADADSVSVAASEEVRALAEKITLYGKKGFTDYMDTEGVLEEECRERWAQNPASQSVLECVLLYDLLYKDLQHAASLLPALQERETLPQPLQEALLIMRNEGMPVADSLNINKSLPYFGRFLQAREMWHRGLKTPAELTSEFGATFAYNYYFSRFITPPAPTASEHRPLAH